MRSLSFAVKLRRFGVVVNSTPGALGAVTTWAGEVAGEISEADPKLIMQNQCVAFNQSIEMPSW
jgi:hypothetical protein